MRNRNYGVSSTRINVWKYTYQGNLQHMIFSCGAMTIVIQWLIFWDMLKQLQWNIHQNLKYNRLKLDFIDNFIIISKSYEIRLQKSKIAHIFIWQLLSLVTSGCWRESLIFVQEVDWHIQISGVAQPCDVWNEEESSNSINFPKHVAAHCGWYQRCYYINGTLNRK